MTRVFLTLAFAFFFLNTPNLEAARTRQPQQDSQSSSSSNTQKKATNSTKAVATGVALECGGQLTAMPPQTPVKILQQEINGLPVEVHLVGSLAVKLILKVPNGETQFVSSREESFTALKRCEGLLFSMAEKFCTGQSQQPYRLEARVIAEQEPTYNRYSSHIKSCE